MLENGFESRIKVQQIIENQLPEFILDENPKAVEFFQQYYISQEYQSGPVDIAENLDQYLNLDKLIPEVIVDSAVLQNNITLSSTTISVSSTKGFPKKYGLLQIDDEIITYTDSTETSFTGCIRGFSGITNYHRDLKYEELVFNTSLAAGHTENTVVKNLSSLFLKEFYRKIKFALTPGLENTNFVDNLNVGNFIRNARTFYQTKGTVESFRILFNVLFGETPNIVDLERFLIKSSDANYIRRDIAVIDAISGNPAKLVGQTITKNTDLLTTASVSKVETITRKNKTYYKLYCFIGYDDTYPTVNGTFSISESSRVIESVQIPIYPNSTVVTVDSTIGFPESGSFYHLDHEIFYQSKSINQFFGCYTQETDNVNILKTSVIRSNNTYYGYEDGDINKKVEFRVTGVLSNIVFENESYNFIINEEISPKNVGEIVPVGTNKKEIFANTWIYNTSTRYQIDSFNNINVVLKTTVELCNLAPGDKIEFLRRNTENVITGFENVEVVSISDSKREIQVNVNTSLLNSSGYYDIRRKIKKASASVVPIEFGNNQLFSDVQNVYSENSEYMYVASNSLPSYQITATTLSYNAYSAVKENPTDTFCSVITFNNVISFLTGDKIYYSANNNAILGLENGTYYVEVLADKKSIKLYESRTAISTSNFVTFKITSEVILSTPCKFTLFSQNNKKISTQKVLKKFKLNPNIYDNYNYPTTPGPVGMLKNGVEIYNYKSNDKIFYGPIANVEILNGGEEYDVINPPLLQINEGNALLEPVVTGSVKEIYVEPQDFNIDSVVSIELSGGNGFGAVFSPVIEKSVRELDFDARNLDNSGGLDIENDRLSFLQPHNLINGQALVYSKNNNNEIGIGNYLGSNNDQSRSLIDGATYYSKIINDKSIQLYQSLTDYNLGINTVGFTTIGNSGIHRFKTEPKNVLKDIKVINGGSNYTYRKLRVSPSGISTTNYTINYENHGFSDGDFIKYSYETTSITGISTQNYYYILKLDTNTFKLCDAGIGGTIRTNYEQKKYVKFSTPGTGYQIFSYPDIELNISCTLAGIGSTNVFKTVNAQPIIRGHISHVYTYEKGSDYGSKILNIHQRPKINIKNGSGAQFNVLIANGKIFNVSVQFGGSDYYSMPDLIVLGDGIGAKLEPVIEDNKIVDVIVINQGIGYNPLNTSVIAVPAGRNAFLQANIRALTVNNAFRYGIQNEFFRDPGSEVLFGLENNLQYSIISYSQNIKNNINDIGELNNHSPIIGWGYDGNPIYGPYAYIDPTNINSPIKIIESSYIETNIENRPPESEFPKGYFVEDYKYDNSGDLDQYNGRFGKTREFPNGVYAYFTTIKTNQNGQLIGQFPYFIGNSYRAELLSENTILNQSFDFNNSNLIRNTYPYKANDPHAGNDFIIESNEIIDQKTVVESVTSGSVDGFEIIKPGTNYSIDDTLLFDENNSDGGSGILAKVAQVTGKEILNLQTTAINYNNSPIIWKSGNELKISVFPYHNFSNGDNIIISGLSSEVSNINGKYTVKFTPVSSSVTRQISNYSTTGSYTDIYLSYVPNDVSIGSSVKINNEIFSIVNLYNNFNIIRVKRGASGVAHTLGSSVQFLPDSFLINKSTNLFESQLNQKIYFNPVNSIGIGTISGSGITTSYSVGITTYNVFIPTQNIYLPNHPFKTGQKVIFRKDSGSSPIAVKNNPSDLSFNILNGNSQTLYAINKSKDYIGIVTNVGFTTFSDGVYFITSGSNDYSYSVETDFKQILVNINQINTVVSVSTSHNLSYGDRITLNVKPALNVGIGTSTTIKLKFNNIKQKLLVNPINISSASVDINQNTIQITNHVLKTGDKILFESNNPPNGLSTDEYFVYKIDNNNISLCETYSNSISSPPIVIDLQSSGSGTHTLSLINPALKIVKNNNVVFDVSDSTLTNYTFNLYTDVNFAKKFVSDGVNGDLLFANTPQTGISTLKYSDYLPNKLYYSLEKDGEVIKLDTDVQFYSEISYDNSVYNGTFNVIGTSTTSFTVSLNDYPEKLNYNFSECDALEYTTNSKNVTGGIAKILLLSNGYGYKFVPAFIGSNSLTGSGAFIIPTSKTIGKILQSKIINEGFEYSSDKTLRPTANIPKTAYVSSSNTIENIVILNGGRNYVSSPNLICVDSDTGNLINSGFLKPILSGSSISSIDIVSNPKGLPDKPIRIVALDNSNGITIDRVELNGSVVSCTLTTPFGGFFNVPFEAGDKIFVEGIQKVNESGNGFNSTDYGYQFFTVLNYYNLDPAILEFDISDYTSNPGTPNPVQFGYATIINFNNYPQFKVEQIFSEFSVGEKLLVLSKDSNNYKESDLIVSYFNQNFVKVIGNYELNKGDRIRGSESLNEANIDLIKNIDGKYNISYFNRQNISWQYNTGKLSDDTQFLPDNDYYQNLSYTVKSTKTWEEIVTPVNNLLHTSGLKNFADMQILSSPVSKVGPGIGTTESLDNTYIKDYISDLRVDSINDLDLVVDIDIITNKSKFLKFNNIFLSDFFLCKTNRVLKIDDISDEFSSYDDEREVEVSNILNIEKKNRYNKFLVLIKDTIKDEVQFTELVAINDDRNVYNLIKNDLIATENKPYVVNVSGYINEALEYYLKFEPYDPFNSAFDIKILQNTFTNVGVASTQSIGFVDLIGSNKIINANSTNNILEFSTSKYKSIYANIHITNDSGSIMNYVEIYLTHDGTDTYITEYYFDNLEQESYNSIGSFNSNITGGKVYLNYTNNGSQRITLSSKYTTFGNTILGPGFYRFKLNGQLDGNERTVVYNSENTTVSSGSTTVLTLDKNIFSAAKSLVQVSYGNTSALHQVLTAFNGTDVYTMQGPLLSIGSTIGIGTFGGQIAGNNFNLIFYPDSSINTAIDVLSFNESFYSDLDKINIPPDLKYGSVIENVKYANYYGVNTQNIDRLDFELDYENQPIFVKTFDPQNSNVLNPSTGIFNIENHFFSTGERLIYTPKSTFIGIGTSALGIGATLNYVGVVTTLLPEVVYAIKDNNSTFRLATRKEYALAGIGVTFTSYGLGNAHELEMFKKNEKSLITINNLIQYPISYTYLTHNLSGNGGQISAGSTIFALSGIGSIRPNDLLKIDNEFMRVDNVGFGSSNTGPITFSGSVPLVEVVRGFVGSSVGIHTDSSLARVYRGSYNIAGNKIHFTQPPRGNSLDLIFPDERNLLRERAKFNGRVFLRNDYTSNQIYDDISDQFTGVGQTFRLTSQGISTVGLGTSGGNGIVLINSIFQSPTTLNNSKNNYIINENLNLGITSITFTGITSTNLQTIFITDDDINQNQLPRGGIIVSLGSSAGLGYEPGVYENLPVVGVSRLGIGQTTETGVGLLLNIEVGSSSTTGIGSTLFEVKSFKVTRNGYGFRRGDVFKPVGLTTASDLTSPISEFTLTVLDTFNDSFACWQFGELDYIDSIRPYQDGVRTRFPLYYDGELRSFQVDNNDSDSQLIDLDSVLIIFINGILQEPKVAYQFNGGTTFNFTTPPKTEDNVVIFFYWGTVNDDAIEIKVDDVIKIGDTVEVFKNNNFNESDSQNRRIVYNVSSSDKIETEVYSGPGIDENIPKPLRWIKQKTDLIINNQEVSKSRQSVESQIYPTANIIRSFNSSSTEIFVDDSRLFDYEDPQVTNMDAIIYNQTNNTLEIDTIKNISLVQGFDCKIIGISTTVGVGAPLALRFTVIAPPQGFTDLQIGYPIYITGTNVGFGVTSLGTSQSDIVAISTSYLNNIYYVHGFNSVTGIITCNISSNTNIVGIATTGTAEYPVGNLMWGRLSGFTRSSSPISIGISAYTSSIGISSGSYSSGLSTYPTIQRRGYGLRNNGSIAGDLSNID